MFLLLQQRRFYTCESNQKTSRMVLLNATKDGQAAVLENTLELQSGLKIHYMVPSHAAPVKENSPTENTIGVAVRKSSNFDGNDPREDWEGVFEMCYALDHAVQFETEDLLKGRKVLEIGFCTALPSVFALSNGAEHVTLHSNDDEMMETYVKPTLTRNKIKGVQRKTFSSSLEDFRKSVNPNEFDVILAVEIFSTEKNHFEEIHDFIDYALTNDGVCLLESRMFYINCEGSLPDFLDLVKVKGKFDVYTRWSSPKTEIIQRKVIQLTRAIR